MTTIVGLDTAANRWHAVANGPRFYKCGPLVGARWDQPDLRRIELARTARDFFATLPEDTHVFAEEPIVLTNGKTTRLLGLAAGAIWAAHIEFDLFWHWVDNNTWKRVVIGRGNADKEAIAEYGRARGVETDEQDYYDAFAIHQYGVQAINNQGWLDHDL